MNKRGVKPGSKRTPYKKKTRAELDAERAKRVEEAEVLLPMYLQPGQEWSICWGDAEILGKLHLMAFAGLNTSQAAKMLQCPEKELIEALKAIPEVKAHWDRGLEDIVTLCHVALTSRIRGMKVTETRRTEKGDGTVDLTTIVKELPPDIDAVKFFLNNRVEQYQEVDAASAFEGRLDTMLGKIEQLDLFS